MNVGFVLWKMNQQFICSASEDVLRNQLILTYFSAVLGDNTEWNSIILLGKIIFEAGELEFLNMNPLRALLKQYFVLKGQRIKIIILKNYLKLWKKFITAENCQLSLHFFSPFVIIHKKLLEWRQVWLSCLTLLVRREAAEVIAKLSEVSNDKSPDCSDWMCFRKTPKTQQTAQFAFSVSSSFIHSCSCVSLNLHLR